MPAGLNFAKVPFRNPRLPGILVGLVAGALLVTTVWHGVVLTRYLLREREELDAKVQSLQAHLSELVTEIGRARTELRADRGESTTQRIVFLADIYRQKGFSWTEFFNQLEAVIPPNVRITSISPNVTEDGIQVRLMTVGRSLEDLLELVRSLEESRSFGTVMPLNEAHQEEAGTVASTITLRYLSAEESPEQQ
jgi:Tfp pilus assembly protein PilN